MKDIVKMDFEHRMSAHCENGATSNLLRYYGVNLSEPMIFGIGAGLSFVYLPFVKLNGAPVTSFRPMPGSIFKKVNKAIGAKIVRKKFVGKPEQAMESLNNIIDSGTPVGMLVGVYNLPYLPAPFRFHFNAHNIVAFARNENQYLISDSVMENSEWISYDDLKLVRYAKGTYKPKGRMYYLQSVNKDFDIRKAIRKGIRTASIMMVKAPGPIIGVGGIRTLSKSIRKWPQKYDSRIASRYLGSIIRMQEEIGTGGAGFRFLYAAFLQEAGKLLKNNSLILASEEMTIIGDLWRGFAVDAGRICKLRTKNGESYDSIADKLLIIADKEEALFKSLLKIKI